MAKHLMTLAILSLLPGALFALPAAPAPAAPVTVCRTAAVPTANTGPALDFGTWLKDQDHTSVPASTCGPNFCTQQQRTQCAQSCHHAPFVGLECCQATCTSFCNCGSVPTGC